jgi:hypothetical protein
MKFIYYSILISSIFISCKNNVENKTNVVSSDYSFLENEWVKITEIKGKKVIYKPCDADNSKVIPNAKSKKITIKYGIEDQTFDYEKITFNNEKNNFKITGVSFLGASIKDIIYTKNNESESTWIVPGNISIISTNSEDKYEKVNESCNNENTFNSSIEYHINEYKKVGFDIVSSKKHDIDLDKISDAFLILEKQSDKTKILVILKGISENNLKIWKQSKTLISNVNDGCPAEGFERVAVKNNYFTIEEANCDGWFYIKTYITFKYLDDILLHKYSIEYTDRRDPNKKVPTKSYSKKDFGKVSFKKFDNKNLPF